MKPINIHIFRGTLTIRLWATLITLVMLAGLIVLGCWQLQRLDWKTDLINQIHTRMKERAVDLDLSVIPAESAGNMDYHPGRASGTFDNEHELYLNAISLNGDGGYDVLTPLRLEDGRVLLVNRGWMPYSLKEKPESNTPHDRLYRPTTTQHVSGILRLPPAEKPVGRPANNPGKNDWYWIDLQSMASSGGVKEFLPYYMEAADAPHDGAWPVGGQTRVNLPNHHFHYAITWFWLAAILPIIYFVSSWRVDRPKKAEEPEKEAEKTDEAKPE